MSYFELLRKIKKEEENFGGKMQLPCSERQLADLRTETTDKLNCQLPNSYADFLKIHNGFQFNGLFIYATEKVLVAGTKDIYIQGFVEMNLNYRDDSYFNDLLVFGDGNTDIYVYQISLDKYQRRDRIPADNIIESFNTFDDMITKALEIHLQ